jgi:hypothetical protein
MRSAPPLLFAGVIAVLAIARPAPAGDKSARNPAEELFMQGTSAMDAGRYEEACPPLEQSYRIEPKPGTLFYLAECEAQRGRIASAVARYKEYMELYPKLSRASRAKQGDRLQVARRQESQLSSEVPMLTLVPPEGASSDLVIQCDGAAVPKGSLGAPFPVDPGEHVVTSWVPGEALLQFHVKLGRGEKLLLRLTRTNKSSAPQKPVADDGMGPAPGPAPDDGGPSPARRASMYTFGGVGLAGLVVGGVAGVLALSKKSEADDLCPSDPQDSALRSCSTPEAEAEATSLSEDSRKFGTVSTAGFIAGGVGLGVAVVLLLTESRGGATSPRASGHGTTVGVLSAGPEGGVFGVRGSW